MYAIVEIYLCLILWCCGVISVYLSIYLSAHLHIERRKQHLLPTISTLRIHSWVGVDCVSFFFVTMDILQIIWILKVLCSARTPRFAVLGAYLCCKFISTYLNASLTRLLARWLRACVRDMSSCSFCVSDRFQSCRCSFDFARSALIEWSALGLLVGYIRLISSRLFFLLPLLLSCMHACSLFFFSF